MSLQVVEHRLFMHIQHKQFTYASGLWSDLHKKPKTQSEYSKVMREHIAAGVAMR